MASQIGNNPRTSLVDTARTTRAAAGDCVSEFAHQGKHYKLHCIHNLAGLASLEADWNQLHGLCEREFTYFQGFDWCSKWAKHFCKADETTLRIYVLREASAGNPVSMIWPMAAIQSKARAKVLVSLSDPLGQYAGLLHDPELMDEALAREVVKAIKGASECDAIAILNCPANSLLAKATVGMGQEDNIQPVSSILDLTQIQSWDAYHASLPRSSRKERNRRRNKLESLGRVEYVVEAAGSQTYRELVSICLAHKQVWLKETGRRSGVLGECETEAFFQDLAAISQGDTVQSGAVVHCLKVDDEPVALELGMVCDGDYYSYLGAINWDWRTRSPGKVQMEFAQRWAKEQGYRKFDFLSDPSDYKAYWTNAKQELVSLNIPVTLKGQLYCSLWKANLKPRLKAFYHKTGAANRLVFNRVFALLGKAKSE